MRPLEEALLAANALAFVALAVSRLRRVRWMHHTRYLAALPLPIAGAQALVEGPRWQMIPAYVLSGVFLLLALVRAAKPTGEGGHGPSSQLAAGLGTGLGVLALAVSIALPIILPIFHFPHPTGRYAIGTVTYHWVDSARPEIFTADPNDRRELVVQIWYPAKAAPSAPRAPYVQDPEALAPAALLIHLPGFIFDHLTYVSTDAVASAPVADDEPSYPMLIFLSGRGGYRQSNTFQVEELVSHGYVVAAIDQPYAAAGVVFPDGRLVAMDPRMFDPAHPGHAALLDSVIPFLAQDVSFALDQLAALNRADPNGILTGRLDLQHEGILGVSLGGILTGQACLQDPRLRACLVMDAFMPVDVVRSGLRQPTMWISRDAATMRREGWTQADTEETQTTMRSVYVSLPGDGYLVLVPGMYHTDFTDAPLFTPLGSLVGLSGQIDPQRAHSIVNAYTLAFFDQHLKGKPAALLNGPAPRYPEVLFDARRPHQR